MDPFRAYGECSRGRSAPAGRPESSYCCRRRRRGTPGPRGTSGGAETPSHRRRRGRGAWRRAADFGGRDRPRAVLGLSSARRARTSSGGSPARASAMLPRFPCDDDAATPSAPLRSTSTVLLEHRLQPRRRRPLLASEGVAAASSSTTTTTHHLAVANQVLQQLLSHPHRLDSAPHCSPVFAAMSWSSSASGQRLLGLLRVKEN